jgi:membrane protease YdiL (CAAX protease family)
MSLPPTNGLESENPSPFSNPDGPAPPPPRAPRRVPNLGHAFLFVSFAGILLLAFMVVLAIMGKSPAVPHGGTVTIPHPMLQIAMMATVYLTTLLVAWLFFPLLWHRPFLDGLQWHWSIARGQANRLVTLGFALGVMMAILTAFISSPKNLPLDQFFATPATAWVITLFGTFAAPVFEEICFRGFLFPAFAIAYDWVALPRTPEARTRWQTTTTLTPASLIFSAILSSLGFAAMHAEQDAHLWAALVGLFSISLILTFVRVKTQSVAASALVHSAYNGFIFLMTIFATGGYRHLDRMLN